MIINFISIFGNIAPPPGAEAYGGSVFGGLVPFLNNILRLIFTLAGLFGFFNLIMAGFGFVSAGGDAKAIEKAWGKIWQSLIGLIVIIGSFILAAIIGFIMFGNATAILNPQIYGPATKPQSDCLKTCPDELCMAWPKDSGECKNLCQKFCAKFP